MTNSLSDKVALVTGANSCIGQAIALKLASQGAAVIVSWADVTSSLADATVNDMLAAGGKAIVIEADMGSVVDIRALYWQVKEWRNQLDIVVNCAEAHKEAPIENFLEDDYERIFAVNTRGVFISLQEAAKVMSDGGRIINIGSDSTSIARACNGVYGASKTAVEYFSRALSHELAPRNITVNTVSSGMTETPVMTETPMLMNEISNFTINKSLFKRVGEPEDVADVVFMLTSDDARWITGQNITATRGTNVR